MLVLPLSLSDNCLSGLVQGAVLGDSFDVAPG